MSNHTSTIARPSYVFITAPNGMRFTAEVQNRYTHQGQDFIDVVLFAAHGYPETFSGGHPVDENGMPLPRD